MTPNSTKPALPEIVRVLAEWEDRNGSLAGIQPDEWAALMEPVAVAATRQSPRMARFSWAAFDAVAAEAQAVPAPPDGWAYVLVPAGSQPDEPDWEHCIAQSEEATGIKVERTTVSIIIREVRRWLTAKQALSASPPPPCAEPAPIDMVLYCPNCGTQHVDAPESPMETNAIASLSGVPMTSLWSNPPHRSHLCHSCGCIWRPADVPTNGVLAVTTEGKTDTWIGKASFAAPASNEGKTA